MPRTRQRPNSDNHLVFLALFQFPARLPVWKTECFVDYLQKAPTFPVGKKNNKPGEKATP
jgi:hypothetical protein